MTLLNTSRLLPIVAAFFTILMLQGCAGLDSLPEIQPPKAKVNSTRITSLSFESVGLSSSVEIYNPNFFPLFEIRADVRVYTQGALIVRISDIAIPERINPNQYADTEIPVDLVFATVFSAVPEALKSNELEYRIEMDIKVPLSVLGEVTVPVTFQGSLPIPKAPEIKLTGLSLGKVSLSRIELNLGLEVRNTNAFAMKSLASLVDVRLNGKKMGGMDLKVADVEPGQTGSSNLQFSFSPLDAGINLLTTQQHEIGLSGKLDWQNPYSAAEQMSESFNLKQSLKF